MKLLWQQLMRLTLVILGFKTGSNVLLGYRSLKKIANHSIDLAHGKWLCILLKNSIS